MTTTTAVAGRGYIRPELEHLAVGVGQVHEYPGNARRGADDDLRTSLATHGQYKPLLVQRSTGWVVAGNNTLRVARDSLGWTHVAVVFLDVDDDTARRMLLIDNRTSDLADYDTTLLADLLAEVPDFTGTGYTELDLDALLADVAGTTALDALPDVTQALPADPDDGPRLPAAPTADPHPVPAPPQEPVPVPSPDPEPAPPPPIPPADPRTSAAAPPPREQLPPTTPPARPAGSPAPTADVPWHLTLTRADRDEALRLVAHARDWLAEPHLTPADVVLRGLRTLAAIGDARHNPTTTVNLTTLLMAAGRDPLALL